MDESNEQLPPTPGENTELSPTQITIREARSHLHSTAALLNSLGVSMTNEQLNNASDQAGFFATRLIHEGGPARSEVTNTMDDVTILESLGIPVTADNKDYIRELALLRERYQTHTQEAGEKSINSIDEIVDKLLDIDADDSQYNLIEKGIAQLEKFRGRWREAVKREQEKGTPETVNQILDRLTRAYQSNLNKLQSSTLSNNVVLLESQYYTRTMSDGREIVIPGIKLLPETTARLIQALDLHLVDDNEEEEEDADGKKRVDSKKYTTNFPGIVARVITDRSHPRYGEVVLEFSPIALASAVHKSSTSR